MTWALIQGEAWGGPTPAPQITGITLFEVFPGDTVTVTGTGFTPENQVKLVPGDVVVATVSTTDTTSVTFDIPLGLPNTKHQLFISGPGGASNQVELFIKRNVSFTDPSGGATSLIGAFN